MKVTLTIDVDDCRLWLNDVYGNEWFVGCKVECEPVLEDGALFLEELRVESIVLAGEDRELAAESLATMPDIFPQAAVNGLEKQIEKVMSESCYSERDERYMTVFDRGGDDE